MRRTTGWLAVLTLAIGLTACGDVDRGAGSASTIGSTTTQVDGADSFPVPIDTEDAATVVDSTSPLTTAGTTTATSSAAGSGSVAAPAAQATRPTFGALDQAAVAGLLWMREEEKLARDVYLALSELWNLPIFANIAASEQAHTDAVGDLLDRYDIPDPMAEDVAGAFVDPAIQKLYDDLVEQGSRSVVDALIVGATIEDMDIVDLQLRRSGVEAIDVVYANLEKGSRNHLRAFIRTLENQGGEYTPSFLTTAEYEAIISSPTERGRAGG